MERETDMSPPPLPTPDGQRTPGWYPDDRSGDGFRHFDGRSWSAMVSSVPVWGAEAATPPRRVRWHVPAAAASAVVVLVLVAGAVTVGRGDGASVDARAAVADGGPAGVASGSTNGPDGSGGRAGSDTSGIGGDADRDAVDGTGADRGADGSESGRGGSATSGGRTGPGGSDDANATGRDGTQGTQAGSTGSGSGSGSGGASTGDGGGVAGGSGGNGGAGTGDGTGGDAEVAGACSVSAARLTEVIRQAPSVASVSARMEVTDVVCRSGWASGIVTSPVTPMSLGVFEQQSGDWVLVGYGHRSPCARLGLPRSLADELRCGEF